MLEKGNFQGAQPLFVFTVVVILNLRSIRKVALKKNVGLRFVDTFRTSNDIW